MPQTFAEELAWVPKSGNLAVALERAYEYARAGGHGTVTLEHLLLALSEDVEASGVLQACDVDIERLRADVAGYLGRLAEGGSPAGASTAGASPAGGSTGAGPVADKALLKIMQYAAAAAQKGSRSSINGAVVLAAIVGEGQSNSADLLKGQGLTFEGTIKALQKAGAQREPQTQPAATSGSSAPAGSTVNDAPAAEAEAPAAEPPAAEAPAVDPAIVPLPAPLRNPIPQAASTDDVLASARERINARRVAQGPSVRSTTTIRPAPQGGHGAALDTKPSTAPVGGSPSAPPAPASITEAAITLELDPKPVPGTAAAVPPAKAEAPDRAAAPVPAPVTRPHSATVPAAAPPMGTGQQVQQVGAASGEPAVPALPPAQPESDAYTGSYTEATQPDKNGHAAAARDMREKLQAEYERRGRKDKRRALSAEPAPAEPGPAEPAPAEPAPIAPWPEPRNVDLQPPPNEPQLTTPDDLTPAGAAGATQIAAGDDLAGAPYPFDMGDNEIAAVQPPMTMPAPAADPPIAPPPAAPIPTLPMPMPQPPPAPTGGAVQPTTAAARQAPPQPRRQPGPEVETGQLLENIPRIMRVAVPETVEVRIARDKVDGLQEGMQGRGTVQHHDLFITKAMSVTLKAPGGGFWIETASPETQWIDNKLGVLRDDYASWRWTVTPQRRGRGKLQFVVSARTVGNDGLAAETQLPYQVVTVKVRVNFKKTFKRLGGWAAAALAGGLISAFGGRVLKLQAFQDFIAVIGL